MSLIAFMPRRRPRVAGFRMGLALWLMAALPAWAIDIPVDTLGDPVPNGCTPGDCSLREAVNLANSLAGPDRILLPATPGLPLQLSIPGANENANATGDLDVLDDLEIIGTGVTSTVLVQTSQDRLFQTTMASNQRLTLRGLTVQGGSALTGGALTSTSLVTIEDVAFIGNDAGVEGGAILFRAPYAPLITEPRLILRRVRFEGNTATQLNNDSYGGALHATSFFDTSPFVLIEDCEFTGNTSKSGGGAIYLSGSVNYFGGSVTVRRSLFSANSSGGSGGGAMLATSSSFVVRVEDSVFDSNTATGSDTTAAGAINMDRVSSSVLLRTRLASNSGVRGGAMRSTSPAEVIDSTLTDNSATLAGGALWAGATLLVDRSTFASNRVTSTSSADDGGGAVGFSGSIIGIQSSTFSDNDAFRGGAISLVVGKMQLYRSTLVAPSSGIAGRLGTVMRILDDTTGNALAVGNSLLRGTCTFPSAGRQLATAYNNIESPGASCRFATAGASAQNQTSATSAQINLGPLANNGGPTLTRLPGAGSIAINQGRESYCAATDQRHYARADALCDIGAVEIGATPDELFRNGFE